MQSSDIWTTFYTWFLLFVWVCIICVKTNWWAFIVCRLTLFCLFETCLHNRTPLTKAGLLRAWQTYLVMVYVIIPLLKFIHTWISQQFEEICTFNNILVVCINVWVWSCESGLRICRYWLVTNLSSTVLNNFIYRLIWKWRNVGFFR